MEHVRVRNFTETGRRLPDVTRPLSKSAVAVAILQRIAKGSGEMDGHTLGDLDSGRIHFSTLACSSGASWSGQSRSGSPTWTSRRTSASSSCRS